MLLHYLFHYLGSLDNAVSQFSKQKQPERHHKSHINRAKSRERIERPLPGQLSSDSSTEDIKQEFIELDINLDNSLQEFEDSLTPEQRKRPFIKKKPKKTKTQKLKEKEDKRKRELVDVLCKGDLEKLKELLNNSLNTQETEEGKEFKRKEFVNEIIETDKLNSLLHIAAMNEHNNLVEFLLENNANPTLKNKLQHTVYTCTQNKEIRETLKQFAKDNPEKFNYNKVI